MIVNGKRHMFQIRVHGRGGQGVVTAAELLSIAAFREDKHAQAFPSFGSERTGAPVMSFCRIDDKEIRLREPILGARHDARESAARSAEPVRFGLRRHRRPQRNSRRSCRAGHHRQVGGTRTEINF
jgi:Pyruvate ferredoxin/flavodoxin oxidoreductase